ncbi:MAG: 23S rRNA (adenine(2503)-C(2))-methyltransferase RlmN [Spirochaetes bacterium]|nr:MAG: 23S rRNA (adenine(2503)-C(2))-methyltransferase RlmN [Spirochaetota bacterium]
MDTPGIKNLTLPEAEEVFRGLGEKPYRARQLFNWLYEKNVDSFESMTNFSKGLRAELAARYAVSVIEVADRQLSALDGTEKFLFRTRDGHFIESVLIRSDGTDDGRLTVCVSSQVGCPMGCLFCQTARIGFKRNLEAAEILDQVCHVRRVSGVRNNNIVFMGMGEPFLNYESVMRAADIMNYDFGFHISVRRITISTCGIADALERYIDEGRPYNLAISLNDTDPEKRRANMPVENKYPIRDIAAMLVDKFPASRNRVTIEYIMRADNIGPGDARRLRELFRHGRIKLNLIPLNTGGHGMEAPSAEAMEKFIRELEIMNVPVSVRKSSGKDIDGACGQLSGRRYRDCI